MYNINSSRKKLLKYLPLFISLCLLTTCRKADLKHDEQYGVRYNFDEKHTSSAITINLDTDNSRYVTALHGYIYYIKDKNSDLNKPAIDTCDKLMNDFDNSYYSFNKIADDVELEYFNIEFHDSDFSKFNYQSLLEYLGLWEALSDDRLDYQMELKDNPNFRFTHILKEGNYHNNISFTGAPVYDVK